MTKLVRISWHTGMDIKYQYAYLYVFLYRYTALCIMFAKLAFDSAAFCHYSAFCKANERAGVYSSFMPYFTLGIFCPILHHCACFGFAMHFPSLFTSTCLPPRFQPAGALKKADKPVTAISMQEYR